MSELKTRYIDDTYAEYYNTGKHELAQIYLKPEADKVIADKDAITQVIYNLLDNAIKFADQGSCLIVRLYKDLGKAYVSVKDFGETIPTDDLPYIFDRFHKSDRSRSLDKEGVGLGLYLVKTIINAHDSTIPIIVPIVLFLFSFKSFKTSFLSIFILIISFYMTIFNYYYSISMFCKLHIMCNHYNSLFIFNITSF